jgi:hypothetical protein
MNESSHWLVDIPIWQDQCIAPGNWIAACVTILVCAREANAMDLEAHVPMFLVEISA